MQCVSTGVLNPALRPRVDQIAEPVVAPHVPAGMIFVPSRRGISHSPEEWTDVADCELGARVLAGTLRRLAS